MNSALAAETEPVRGAGSADEGSGARRSPVVEGAPVTGDAPAAPAAPSAPATDRSLIMGGASGASADQAGPATDGPSASRGRAGAGGAEADAAAGEAAPALRESVAALRRPREAAGARRADDAAESPVAKVAGASPPEQLQPGTSILGKYRVLGVLGQGGFAVVYDAEHVGLRRPVAIKVLHVGNDTPLALIERFRREARISALVRHRNVLEAYDTGTLPDGSPYLVMERINGQNLSVLLARGPLPIATAVEIGRQLLLGLSAIANAGIVHRDIKPENVMLHDPGDGAIVVKLVDFGIAKRVSVTPEPRLTYHGALVGTPQYMAPEQIRGEEVDVRSDLYATGAILYEALSGHPPHETSNFSELVVAVLSGRIESLRRLRPNCPPELDRVVLRALARTRTRRYASPGEFLAALERVAAKYALPRAGEAFRASSDAEWAVLGPARHCTTFVRWLRQPAGPRSRVLQLTFMVLLLGAPGAALRVRNGHSAGAAAKFDAPLHRVEVGAPVISELRPARAAEGTRPQSAESRKQPVVTPLHAPTAAVSSGAGEARGSSRLAAGAPAAEAVAAAGNALGEGASDRPGGAAEHANPFDDDSASGSVPEPGSSAYGLEGAVASGRALGGEVDVESARGRGAANEDRNVERADLSDPAPAHDSEPSRIDTAQRASGPELAEPAAGAREAGPIAAQVGGEGARVETGAADPAAQAVAAADPAGDTEALAAGSELALGEPGRPRSAARGTWPAGDDPSKRRAWNNAMQQGLAALVRGQLGAARERYLEAVRIDAREPSGFRGLGLVAARLGDAQQASTALARYLALAPHASDAPAIRARIATLSNATGSAPDAARADGKAP